MARNYTEQCTGKLEVARKHLHILIFEMQKPAIQRLKAAEPKLTGRQSHSQQDIAIYLWD